MGNFNLSTNLFGFRCQMAVKYFKSHVLGQRSSKRSMGDISLDKKSVIQYKIAS